jgi:hypothetical protein
MTGLRIRKAYHGFEQKDFTPLTRVFFGHENEVLRFQNEHFCDDSIFVSG